MAFGGNSDNGAEKLKLENMPFDFGGVAGMGAYVVLPLVAGEEGWEGVRADKKSSVKKAREKAQRITTRGVRIAASSEPKARRSLCAPMYVV